MGKQLWTHATIRPLFYSDDILPHIPLPPGLVCPIVTRLFEILRIYDE